MARPSYPSDDVDKTLLRFPEGMRDILKAEAAKNKRSLNAEIIHRLETTLLLHSLSGSEAQSSGDAKADLTDILLKNQKAMQEQNELLKSTLRALKDHGINVPDLE